MTKTIRKVSFLYNLYLSIIQDQPSKSHFEGLTLQLGVNQNIETKKVIKIES